MELLYWFYDILLLSMSLAQESQAAAFGAGGGLVPAGPWFSGTGAEQNQIPRSDVCQVTKLEEGLLPTLRNAGQVPWFRKFTPHTHGHISSIFIISSWKNIGKSGFYMFPPNPNNICCTSADRATPRRCDNTGPTKQSLDILVNSG